MAGVVYRKMIKSEEKNKPGVGRQILDILTSGMYSSPLMVVREYIQNATDAIDQVVCSGDMERHQGVVSVNLDGQSNAMTIEDNGCGVPNQFLEQVLCSIGISEKSQATQRGFRGIGRLGGIGYADQVTFETRSHHSEKIGVVKWDSRQLREYVSHGGDFSIEEAVQASVLVSFLSPNSDDPPHFFRVRLDGIRRFHNNALMNVDAIRDYLSQTTPVPFNNKVFQFANKLEKELTEIPGYESYRINVNGEQIFKPYADAIINGNDVLVDKIEDVEVFNIYSPNKSSIGKGWYAVTNLLASLSPSVLMRGIRVRQGNIGIGDEYFLAEVFTERRFATWQIGEIHVDSSFTPNARRDGFEQCPCYESFLEQANLLGKHLSRLCRATSKKRSLSTYLRGCLMEVEDFGLSSFFLDREHYEKRKSIAEKKLSQVSSALEKEFSCDTDLLERYLAAEVQYRTKLTQPNLIANCLDGRKMKSLSNKEIVLELCRKFVDTDNNSTNGINSVIEAIRPYLRESRG